MRVLGVLAPEDPALAAEALAEMEPEEHPEDSLAALHPDQIAAVVAELSDDDAADMIGEMDPEDRDRVLAALPHEDAGDIRDLMRYDEESAGGIMTTELVVVPVDATAAQAIDEVRRQAQEVEDFYGVVFVVDADEVLLGTVSLQALVTADPGDARGASWSSEPERGGAAGDGPGRGGARALPLQPDHRAGGGQRRAAAGRRDLRRRDRRHRGGDHGRHPQVRRRVGRGGAARRMAGRGPLAASLAAGEPVHGGGGRHGGAACSSPPSNELTYLAVLMPMVAGLGGNSGTQALAVTIRRLLALARDARSSAGAWWARSSWWGWGTGW